eukprot:UN11104
MLTNFCLKESFALDKKSMFPHISKNVCMHFRAHYARQTSVFLKSYFHEFFEYLTFSARKFARELFVTGNEFS